MKRSTPGDDGTGGSGGGGGGGGGAPPPKKHSKAVSTAVEEALELARKAVEDNFQCSVCISLLFEPVTSSCGHNACFECLSRVVAATPAAPLCPTCRGPIVRQPSKWSINSGITSALASNNGPGYRLQAKTLKFHGFLRDGKAGDALSCLVEGGVDLGKALRQSGVSQNPLYFALEKKAADFDKLAMKMIQQGADFDSGVGALDKCHDLHIAELLLSKGAKKCTSQAFLNVSHWIWHDYVISPKIDKVLVDILSLLPQPLNRLDINLRDGLYWTIRNGHVNTSMALLKAGVPFDVSGKCLALHDAASRGCLDVVKFIYERDPTVIMKTNATAQDPLHLACLHRHAPVALFLIEKGLGKKALFDDGGYTALFYASRWASQGDMALQAVANKIRALLA